MGMYGNVRCEVIFIQQIRYSGASNPGSRLVHASSWTSRSLLQRASLEGALHWVGQIRMKVFCRCLCESFVYKPRNVLVKKKLANLAWILECSVWEGE
jgi:hypothetical protein